MRTATSSHRSLYLTPSLLSHPLRHSAVLVELLCSLTPLPPSPCLQPLLAPDPARQLLRDLRRQALRPAQRPLRRALPRGRQAAGGWVWANASYGLPSIRIGTHTNWPYPSPTPPTSCLTPSVSPPSLLPSPPPPSCPTPFLLLQLLLLPHAVRLLLHHHHLQVQFLGLSEHQVSSVEALLQLIEDGQRMRSTGSTAANADSSR